MAISFFRSLNGRSGRSAKSRLVTGAFLISFSVVCVKVCHVLPTVSAFYRVLFGGLLLLAAVLVKREVQWLQWRHMTLGLLCGLLFAADLICYHYSIFYIGPGLGTILPNFQVFLLAVIGAMLLKEKVRPITIISMPIAFTGLFLIMGTDWTGLDPLFKVGIYFGLSAAVFYALFLLSLRKLQSEQGGKSILYILDLAENTVLG